VVFQAVRGSALLIYPSITHLTMVLAFEVEASPGS
jgi:hypothetical protein